MVEGVRAVGDARQYRKPVWFLKYYFYTRKPCLYNPSMKQSGINRPTFQLPSAASI